MTRKENRKKKRNRQKLQKPNKDINDLIDELAYSDENAFDNILKSKRLLDDMYILFQE